MKTAVVILNWNGIDYLKLFLKGVVEKTASDGCAVILADNGSTDESVNWVKKEVPGVKIVQNGKNLGFAKGYVEALNHIEAEYFVLLNSDVEVTENWLDPVISFMDRNKDVAACQPKILSHSNKTLFEHAGAAGGFIDKYGYPFCRGRILDRLEEDNGQYDDITDIFWASGASLFIRSSVWRETMGFDTSFFAHMEEIDLCWRIHSLGYRVCYIPQSVIYHIGGGTLNYNSPAKIYYNFRNNLYLLHKNLPVKGFRQKLFVRKVLDGIAAIRFLLMLNIKAFRQVVRAHKDYYREQKALDKKREEILSSRRSNPGKLILGKSIVWLYYLKGKKTFSDIWPESKTGLPL